MNFIRFDCKCLMQNALSHCMFLCFNHQVVCMPCWSSISISVHVFNSFSLFFFVVLRRVSHCLDCLFFEFVWSLLLLVCLFLLFLVISYHFCSTFCFCTVYVKFLSFTFHGCFGVHFFFSILFYFSLHLLIIFFLSLFRNHRSIHGDRESEWVLFALALWVVWIYRLIRS